MTRPSLDTPNPSWLCQVVVKDSRAVVLSPLGGRPMLPRLRVALLLSLSMTVGAVAVAAQSTPTPDVKDLDRRERLRIHEERVKGILEERERQQAAKGLSADAATSGTMTAAAFSLDRQARLREHEARVKAILAERRLERSLADSTASAAWRADTIARRQKFEADVRANEELMAVATQLANWRIDPTGATLASTEQVEQELSNAIARVYKREDRYLEGRPPQDLRRALSISLRDADTDEVSKVFAEQGVKLRFEGAPKQARLTLAGSNRRAVELVLLVSKQAGGRSWLLADDTVLITDGEPPLGASPLGGTGSSPPDFPELADPSSSGDLAREALRLSTLLYSEYLLPGSAKDLLAPTPPPLPPAPPPDPPLDSGIVFSAS